MTKKVLYPSHEKLEAALIEIRKIYPNATLVGGLAMQLYGSRRLTDDVDVAIASSAAIDLPGKRLSFGGVRWRASNGIKVDVIRREDELADLYDAAIADAPGQTVEQPWLALMKMMTTRAKDSLDLKFLLAKKSFPLDTAERLARKYLGIYAEKEINHLAKIAWWEKSQDPDREDDE